MHDHLKTNKQTHTHTHTHTHIKRAKCKHTKQENKLDIVNVTRVWPNKVQEKVNQTLPHLRNVAQASYRKCKSNIAYIQRV